MSIKETKTTTGYQYRITSFKRSKIRPNVRVQKQRTITSATPLSKKKLEQAQKELDYLTTRELIEKESQGIKFSDLVDRWYDYEYHEQRISRSTLGDYFGSLKKWCFPIWNSPTELISPRDIKQLFKNMEDNGKSKSHQQTMKTVINHVLNWGINEGLCLIEKLPTHGIAVKRSDEKVPEILTLEQVRYMLKEAKTVEHPWYPVWLCALLTGCRNGELYALRWDDVSIETRLITISRSYNNRLNVFKSTKSGCYRTVPINNDLEKLLKELKLQTYKSGYVLPRLSGWKKGDQARILRTFLISIGLPSVRFHTLRACFATMLLSQGQKPAHIMKVCGWTNLKTMERYIRMAGIDESGVTDNLEIMPKENIGRLIEGVFDPKD